MTLIQVKTRVLRKTLNPFFDETFTFYGIDENLLSGITLHFVVLSFDRFSRDDVIGEVVYQLDELDADSSKKSALTVNRQILPRQIKVGVTQYILMHFANDRQLFWF
jgi:synaptotagmin-4